MVKHQQAEIRMIWWMCGVTIIGSRVVS